MCPNTLFTLLGTILILIFTIVIHEFMHGWVASQLGDDTARLSGRLTLNPIPHIDPFGTVLLPAMLIFVNSPVLFGWAKPVPINPLRFKNFRQGTALTALAGPLTNLVIAFTLALIVRLNIFTDPQIVLVLTYGVFINLVLMSFNLIPVPPLDGSKILSLIYPEITSPRLEAIGPFILLALLFLGAFSYVIIPVVGLFFRFFAISMGPLSCPLF